MVVAADKLCEMPTTLKRLPLAMTVLKARLWRNFSGSTPWVTARKTPTDGDDKTENGMGRSTRINCLTLTVLVTYENLENLLVPFGILPRQNSAGFHLLKLTSSYS